MRTHACFYVKGLPNSTNLKKYIANFFNAQNFNHNYLKAQKKLEDISPSFYKFTL